jgi:transglutaminase-like putative cysteine protease
MKKVVVSITSLVIILGLVGCLSFGSSESGNSESNTDSQIKNSSQGRVESNSSNANRANNESKVPSARPEASRSDPARTDTELVMEAIRWGDCSFLDAYTRGNGADRQLVAQANNAIKRYTTLDNGTRRYRTGKMEARVRRVPQNLTDQVFIDPKTVLPEVVSSLTNGITDQFLKVKTIHDWICDNIAYDAKMYFSGRITAQDYTSVLRKKLAVCSGYTNLFNEMCRLAGIESIGINGYSKGFGYTGKIGNNTDHAWNAVYIGNKWYLLDVTWDAGSLDQKTYIKGYSTEWLFLDSRPFLYSHLPEEEAYQYHAPVLTTDDFMREAYIAGKFFQYGLSLKTEMPEYNNDTDGSFAFDIGLSNANVMVSSGLRTSRQQEINAASWTSRRGTVVTCEFDVPDTSEYKGHIFVRYNNEVRLQDRVDSTTFEQDWLPRAEQLYRDPTLTRDRKITESEFTLFKGAYFKILENNKYYFAEDQFDTAKNNAILKVHQLLDLPTNYLDNILSFNIKTSSGYQGFGIGSKKYPSTFGAYNQASNTQLISPIKGVLQNGIIEPFSISSRDYTKIAIIINGDFTDIPKNNKNGNFELDFEIPSGITELDIYGTRDGRNYMGLIKYTVK